MENHKVFRSREDLLMEEEWSSQEKGESLIIEDQRRSPHRRPDLIFSLLNRRGIFIEEEKVSEKTERSLHKNPEGILRKSIYLQKKKRFLRENQKFLSKTNMMPLER